jgi:hypothetical protein
MFCPLAHLSDQLVKQCTGLIQPNRIAHSSLSLARPCPSLSQAMHVAAAAQPWPSPSTSVLAVWHGHTLLGTHYYYTRFGPLWRWTSSRTRQVEPAYNTDLESNKQDSSIIFVNPTVVAYKKLGRGTPWGTHNIR